MRVGDDCIKELLLAALNLIDEELCRVMWNKKQKEYPSPFQNTGNRFKCNIFQVEAYNWDDIREQPFNFKWNEIEVSWYKHVRRDMQYLPENLTADRVCEMLHDYIRAIEEL